MERLIAEVLASLSLSPVMALLFILQFIALGYLALTIVNLRIAIKDIERRQDTHADYFDVQMEHFNHAYQASLKALEKSAKSEGSVETLIKAIKTR